MSILTIRSVPDELHERLKSSALRNGRSLNSEVIECLRVGLAARRPRDVEGFLERARAAREGLAEQGVTLTSADLVRAREGGRA